MRTWCALAVLVGTTAGCDVVFGLEERPAPDAALVSVSNLRFLGAPPIVGEMGEVRADVRGLAGTSVTFELTATGGGMLVPTGGLAELDINGDAQIASTYVPNRRGSVTMAAMVETASVTMVFAVRELVIAGLETGSTPVVISGNQYYGAKINLGEAGELTAVGLRSMVTTTRMAKVGLYTNNVDRPGVLVVALPTAQVVQSGRVVFPMPATTLAAGDYWLVAIFDGPTTVTSEITSGAYGFTAGTFADPMPSTLPAWGTSTDRQLSYFVQILAP